MAVEKIEKVSNIDKFSSFISKNKITLIIIAVVIVVALIAVGITITALNNRLESRIEKVELFQDRLYEWAANPDALTDEELSVIADDLGSDLQEFIDNVGKGYPELRAMHLQATLSYSLEDYVKAAEYYSLVAETYPKSHLAAPSLYNAAVAHEMLENPGKSLEIYLSIIEDYTGIFSEVPHALFSTGRIYESLGDVDSAIGQYRTLSTDYPSSEWSKLAVSRIIVLE